MVAVLAACGGGEGGSDAPPGGSVDARPGGGSADADPGGIPDPPAAPPPGKAWRLAFDEEFDGAALDTTKLTPCFDWNYGDCTGTFNNGRERYLPSQIQLADGVAHMVAEPLVPPEASEGCFEGSCTYKAGLLSTARPNAGDGSPYLFAYTYGFVEARLKFPGDKGFFTAFWMLPADPSFEYATEIDIVEILGHDPSQMWMHYHYAGRTEYHRVNGADGDNGACAHRDYSTDYVRVGLDWQPDHIAWYLDGVECGRYEGDASTIESGPMQIILNNMVDNNWQRDWGQTTDDQTVTREMAVDWIRVHQAE